MDSIKISGQSHHAVKQSQTVAKERDEGYSGSQSDASKLKVDDTASVKTTKVQSHTNKDFDAPSNVLVEQRKQELAKQTSNETESTDQASKREELSVQRKLESRAAANNQKIRNSYNAVQQENSQQKVDTTKAESANNNEVTKQAIPEPINLVV